MEFGSLESFLVHFAGAALAVERQTNEALEKAAVLVEKDAKKRIGVYQESVGPHPAWATLEDSTMQQRERMGFTPDDPLLRTGHLRDSIQHEVDANEKTAVVGSKEAIAEYQEFGTRTIPARPFIGPAAFANKDKIKKLIGQAAMRGLYSGGQIHAALGYDDEIG